MSVAVEVGADTALAGLHGNDDLTVLGACDVLEEQFRLAVGCEGCLCALRAGGDDAVGGDVHHLDEAGLSIVGQLPEVAAVGAVDVGPHGFALEGGVHGLCGVGGDFLEDFLVVLVVLACADAFGVGPYQGADDAVVAVGDGELHDGGHDGSIAVLDVLDDGINLLDCNVGYLARENLVGLLQVLDEEVVDFVAAVVLSDLGAAVECLASVAGQVLLVGAEAGVEA